jgi:hypothetical protein
VTLTNTPISIEVVQDGDERFPLMSFADGCEDRRSHWWLWERYA